MAGGGAATADDDVLAQTGPSGWRGLMANKKSFGIALFASLGGVLYGCEQRARCSDDTNAATDNQGVFGQVQVMASFKYRYAKTVSVAPRSQRCSV